MLKIKYQMCGLVANTAFNTKVAELGKKNS